MIQPQFPLMPSPKGKFKDWLEAWFERNYPEPKTDKTSAAVREEILADLPYRYVPVAGRLVRSWLAHAVQDAMKTFETPRSYLYQSSDPVIVQQLELPFDEFRLRQIGKFVLVKGDIEAIIHEANAYAERWPGRIPDVDAYVSDIRAAAGL